MKCSFLHFCQKGVFELLVQKNYKFSKFFYQLTGCTRSKIADDKFLVKWQGIFIVLPLLCITLCVINMKSKNFPLTPNAAIPSAACHSDGLGLTFLMKCLGLYVFFCL